jgi:hypothetical protein
MELKAQSAFFNRLSNRIIAIGLQLIETEEKIICAYLCASVDLSYSKITLKTVRP